ncbi:GNAT family N-acetyltransferase [Bacteriovorax sp. PP10]|uniref:GNAT family N-acetyltransferase n=1 Tax=Bacteriovorax antarcticus TaxID=3088717 RepID=A0ABU5VWJ3_9BACT|nr:GNAT family N-acetyltransferase [Bacteriovorax sp. PP10]MEA9357411.1 GNAT family N-acetyltransferase [Bacteriovorax sp. PP10]
MKIHIAKTPSDLESFYPLLTELRTHLTYENFLDTYHHAHKNDQYELVGFFEEETVIALIGYRVLYDFVRGRHLYIDDLITSETVRSQGIGARILEFAEERAKELKCTGGLRLCAGIENTDGIKFYEKNGWKARALAFVKRI